MKLLSKALSLVLLLAILPVVIPTTAYAQQSTATFAMSESAVRAGEVVEVTQVTPCPAITNPTPMFPQHVRLQFTDADGSVSGFANPTTILTDNSGNWTGPVLLYPPVRKVQSLDPAVFTDDAALGAGAVSVQCYSEEGVVLEYASQTLSVNGPSAGFTVTPGNPKVNGQVQLEPTVPCPAGTTVMQGIMSQGMSTVVYESSIDSGGYWTAEFEIPESFPLGDAQLTAFCRTELWGGPTFAYAESHSVVSPDKLNYGAMGDSYSSGEGVGPFELGTEQEGGCHRSVGAYPRVLEADPGLKLVLEDDFVTCSGATTASITIGGGQEAQLDVLTGDTDLVALTISGNNIPFKDFAIACAHPTEGEMGGCDGSATAEALSGITYGVIPSLEYMLGTIRDRLIYLGNSDATVLVLGYPHILPEDPGVVQQGSCGWVDSLAEVQAVREVITALNTAIQNEVEAIGYDFHFISATGLDSPFHGRELCRSTLDPDPPYFVEVSPFVEEEYIFHPNAQGQIAYADMVRSFLMSHPMS